MKSLSTGSLPPSSSSSSSLPTPSPTTASLTTATPREVIIHNSASASDQYLTASGASTSPSTTSVSTVAQVTSSSIPSSSSTFSPSSSSVASSFNSTPTSTDSMARPAKTPRHHGPLRSTLALTSSSSPIQFVPLEIIYEVAVRLSANERVACARVCKGWRRMFTPFLWETLSHHQWGAQDFPFYHTHDPRLKKAVFNPNWVRHLAWDSTDTLTLPVWMRDIVFGLVLELPNLESLRMSSQMTRVTGVVLDALLNKDNFTPLVELDLDLMPFQGKGLVHLDSLYPRLARLRKLSLAGSWYLEETGAHISGQSNPDPWKLESLCIPRQHLRILRMCGHLRRLELTHNQHSVEPTYLSPLLSCPELQELIFARGGFNFLDFGRTMPHLNALTLLKISVSRQEQFLQLHILTDKHIAPALRHLEVTYRSVTASGQENLLAACQDLMLTILVTRKKMEVFILEGLAVEAATFFRLGKEVTSKPCLKLKQVWLEIRIPLLEGEATVRRAAWDSVYSQMRLNDTLRNITLISLGLHATIERGFSMLGQLPSLNKITLVDSTKPNWSKAQVVAILFAAPRLKALNLEPLSDYNRAQVNGWLEEYGRAELQL